MSHLPLADMQAALDETRRLDALTEAAMAELAAERDEAWALVARLRDRLERIEAALNDEAHVAHVPVRRSVDDDSYIPGSGR